MAQMEIIVNKLNRRKNPVMDFSDKSNIVDIVVKGVTFESVGQIENKLGKWHHDRDGFYYWSGGVKEAFANPVSSKLNLDANKMSWGHEYYNLPFIWSNLGTAGSGVVVAVIDTGIDIDHNDLKSQIHPLSKSFVKNITSISDENGHGTNMAGIIAGTGSSKVFGVAPEAKLLVLKGTAHRGGVVLEEFSEAINFAASIPEVDIISISYAFVKSFADQSPSLHDAILKCIQAKKIILAAIGNSHTTDPDLPTYPACYNKPFPETDSLMTVGAFDQGRNISDFSNRSKHLRYLAPGESILTTALNNESAKERGTSIATAFAAGCLALLVSYAKRNNRPIDDCFHSVLTSCDDVGSSVGFDNASGLGLLNLRNAISKIKK